MSVIQISRTTILHHPLPRELQGHISPDEYQAIKNTYTDAYSKAQFTSCLVEGGVCCVTGILCVFCFHPCITSCIFSTEITNPVTQLNYRLFNGAGVLTVVNNGDLLVNSSLRPHPPLPDPYVGGVGVVTPMQVVTASVEPAGYGMTNGQTIYPAVAMQMSPVQGEPAMKRDMVPNAPIAYVVEATPVYDDPAMMKQRNG